MKQLIKWEELSIFILSIFLVYKLNFRLEWWQYFLLFFTPDIGMIGYLIDTKWGAITYNILHHKASSTVLILCGLLLTNDWLLVIGLLFFAHAAFDRVLGFGLTQFLQLKQKLPTVDEIVELKTNYLSRLTLSFENVIISYHFKSI